ncbi:MAG: hypothetical protein DYH20_05080 [Gammaproteobacteria bacterium PRO9]|nr:hypothetical protein [Gammaproteobacteria bacterium PRO9]
MIDLRRFYRPPVIGLFAFFAVLLANPVAHSLSVALKESLPKEYTSFIHLAIGAVGMLMLVHGTRQNSEVRGTLLGFGAGLLVWLGWASYAFIYNQLDLQLSPVALTPEQNWPQGLLYIQGSVGICIAALLFMTLNKDTKCNAFRWLQRHLHLNLGKSASGDGRNFCRITFLETIMVTWFCYSASLFMADSRFLGHQHPVTMVLVGLLAIWAFYMLWRLLKFNRVMAGIRYAIPVKAIFWIPFGEFLPDYGLYEEVWLHPTQYSLTMWAVFLFFIVLLVSTVFLPQRRLVTADDAGNAMLPGSGRKS